MKQSRLLLMLLGLFFSFISLSAQAVWDGSVATSFAGGSGTQDDPYLISNGAELAYLAQITNEDADGSLTRDKFFKLTADIVLNRDVLNDDFTLNGIPANVWQPIGEPNHKFFGNFDGGKHRIYGPYMPNPQQLNYNGVIGFCDGATIHDLCVVDGYTKGGSANGLVVGQAANSTISRCYASGRAEGGSSAGLIVGLNQKGMIEYCYSNGYVVASYSHGGIVGEISSGTTQNCFSVVTLGSGYYYGSCVGRLNGGNVSNVYNDNDVCKTSPVGRTESNSTTKDCQGLTTKVMKKASFLELLGEPFEYVEGNYPWIPGMMRVGEYWGNGHQLTLDEVTNGENCTIGFYKGYDGTTFSGRIPSGDRLDLASGETVYVRVKLAANKLLALDDGMKATNQTTGETIPVKVLSDSLLTFQWPGAPVSISAEFIDAAYCGKEEGGRNVMWQKFMLEGNYYKLVFTGQGEIADFSNNSSNRPWGGNASLKELVFEDGVESTGDYAFYYANALDTVSWGTLKHIGIGAFYRPYKLGMNTTIVFPSTLETIGPGAFEYGDDKVAINGIFDFSACTNLTEVGEVAFYGTSVTCILPPSVKASYKNSFRLTPYMVLPEGMTLFVNNTQMPDDGSKATINLTLSQPFTFQLKPNYYRLNLGEVSVEGCTLQFYTTMNTSYQLSNEVKAGMKAFYEDEDAKVYIKFTPASNAYLEKDGIRVVDATGKSVPLKQETVTIFSFVMPNSDVTISAQFVECVLAGIQGNITWSVREDGIWSDEGNSATPGTKKYKLVFSGTGGYGGVSSNGSAPWSSYSSGIGSVVYEEGITDAGDGSMKDLPNLYSVTFPSTMTLLGYGMFKSNYNLKYLKMPVLLSDNSDQSVFAFTANDLTVDFSECTQLTTIGSGKYNGFKGTAILNEKITTIQKQAFISPNNPIKIYFVAPTDKTLFLNDVQSMVEPNEKGWIELVGYNQQNAYTVEWREGYHNHLSLGELTGESGTNLAFYSTYDGKNLSNQLTAGNKLLDSMTGQTIYVKASLSNYRRIDDEGLMVINKASGERLAVKVESQGDNIYSFTFPDADVTVSCNTIIGGYCGDTSFNGGFDARWELSENGIDEDSKPTYKMTVKGTGAMANVKNGWSGWRYTGLKITELEIEEGITRIGAMCFYETAVKKAKLANSILSIGDNAFRGWTEYEGALVMPSSLTQLDYRAFERSTFDLDFTPCTQFKELKDGLNVWCGARVIMPASLEKITVNRAFCGSWQEGCCTYVDLSRCTKLTDMGSNVWFDDCKDGEIILPGSFVGLNIPTVSYGGFENCTSKLSIAVPDDKVLYIDGQRMEETDGKADISAWMGQTVEFDWRAGFSVKTGTLTGKEGTLRYYTDYDGRDLGNEIPNGYKVTRETDDVTLYVQAYSDYTIFPEHLNVTATIDGVSQTVEAEELKHNLFRFTLPAGAVKVSAKFSLGGYCGDSSVNEGRDTRWQIDGSMTLKIYGTGKVDSREWVKDKYPWRTVKAIEVCEGVTSLPENSFNGVNYGTGNEQLVPITLPSTLEEIGAFSFRYCVGNVDMSKCTKMAYIGESVLCGLYGDVLLSPTIARVSANALWGITEGPQHIYVPVASDQVLLVNGEQLKDVNGKVDLISIWPSLQYKHDESEDFFLSLHKGYFVSAAANSNGVLKVYVDQALTQEIQAGFKAIRDNDNTPIYIKVTPNDTKILFKSGLTVNGKSGSIAVTQIGDEVFSFMMPAEPVEATAQFSTGGYCGTANVNNGHNLIWTLENGTLAFQKNAFAQGNDVSMGNNAPWSTLGTSITEVDLDGVSSIGNNAFSSCTRLTGIELPASPILTVGTNAFAKQMWIIVPSRSWKSYQAASGWSAYGERMAKDKETLALKDGQQWLTYYSKVGRMLPEGIKAYAITDVTEEEAIASEPLSYIPAHQAVLIENRQKTAGTIEATTSILPNAQSETPVCLQTTSETNLLQWLTEPTPVKVGQGYILYKDEFVKVSTGTLPADIAFLSIQGVAASRLSIFNAFDDDEEVTGVDVVKTDVESGKWYTIDGKILSGRPTKKGLYVKDGQKVVIR